MKIRLFVLISILVLLTVYFFVYIFSHAPHRYESYNWIARLAAPNFILPLDTIEQTDQNSLIDEYKRRGYNIKCCGCLRPENKILKTDDYVCWGIIKSAYDNIPAKEIAFIFSKGQLQFVRIEFPELSFEKLKDYLNRRLANYQRLDQIPGMKSEKDFFGKPFITWIVRKGYITTSASPTPSRPVFLLWTNQLLVPASPASIAVIDVVAQLEKLAATNRQKLNWKISIVDLLKLVDIDSSLAARRELAIEFGCPSEKMDD